MKQKILKNKLYLLLFALSLFYACQNDDFKGEIDNMNNQIYKHVSISELPQIEPLLEKMKKIKPNSNITSKSSETYLGVDNVNTDDIIQIVDDNGMDNFIFGIDTDFENSQYYENLILSEVNNGYIAYIMRYTPTQEWINNPLNYTPEGDLVLDLNTFEGTITKYALDRQVVWSTNPTDNKSSGEWVEVCFFTTATMCTNDGHGAPNGDPHTATGNCTGPFYIEYNEEFCLWSFVGGGSSDGTGGNSNDGNNYPDDPTGGGNNPHNDDCGETSGTLITDGQPIDGINTGCTSNETIGIKQIAIDDCINNIENDLSLDLELGECLSNVNSGSICEINNSIDAYLEENQSSQESILLAQEYIEILCEVPNAKWERFKELKELIEEDPWALIQDCAQQNGLNTQDYLDLYNLPFPQECSDRLSTNIFLGPHQPITNGNVPLANIDYYGVEITQMPDINGDGNPDSEAEVYQEFRENFTNLASGSKDDFQFSCNVPFSSTNTGNINWDFIPFLPEDQSDFNSDNPISSVLLIEASAYINGNVFDNIPTDEGAIIVSDFTPNDWTISTIRTTSNGSQPFSGNRQWGWIINEAGNTELFTRAVDVARINKVLNLIKGTDTDCQQDTYYDIADATWVNLQEELEQWILNNGGQANIKQPIAVKVEKEKIIELLTTEETIDQINCD
jgi:hypothetical protein